MRGQYDARWVIAIATAAFVVFACIAYSFHSAALSGRVNLVALPEAPPVAVGAATAPAESPFGEASQAEGEEAEPEEVDVAALSAWSSAVAADLASAVTECGMPEWDLACADGVCAFRSTEPWNDFTRLMQLTRRPVNLGYNLAHSAGVLPSAQLPCRRACEEIFGKSLGPSLDTDAFEDLPPCFFVAFDHPTRTSLFGSPSARSTGAGLCNALADHRGAPEAGTYR